MYIDLEGLKVLDRISGPPGLYGCHGGTTQRWQLDSEAKLRSGEGGETRRVTGFPPQVAAFAWGQGT